MTARPSEHDVAVTAWLRRAARGSRAEIIEAFEQAFTALWRRSQMTLGEVTLTAIVERVLNYASWRYPALAAVALAESEGAIRCDSLRTAADLPDDQVGDALGFVLVQLLTVLGNLTAEILTPALHAELAKCSSHAKDVGISEHETR